MKNLAKTPIKVGAGFLVLATGLYVLYRTSELGQAAEALSNELAAAKREGLPLERSDVRTRETSVEATEAAAIYRDLRKWNRETRIAIVAGVPFQTRTPTQADALAATAALNELKVPLAEAKRASGFPHCDINGSGFALYSTIVNTIAAFTVRAEVAAQSGDFESAFDDLETAQRIKGHIEEDPDIPAGSLQACEHVVLSSAMRIIGAHGSSTVVRSRALQLYRHLGPLPDLVKEIGNQLIYDRIALRRIAGVSLWTSNDQVPLMKVPAEAQSPFGRTGICLAAYESKLIHHLRGLATKFKSATPEECMRDYSQLMARLDAAHNQSDAIAHAWLPKLKVQILEALVCETHRNLFFATLYALNQKVRTGTYPASLPKGTAFLDPTRDRPLEYYRVTNGFRIWSAIDTSRARIVVSTTPRNTPARATASLASPVRIRRP